MRETKVLVNELPECCFSCLMYNGVTGCMLGCKMEVDDDDWECYAEGRDKDCPLQTIKEHDNEILEKERERAFVLYSTLYDMLEKQGNENIASMIDQLTFSNYSDLCDLYKSARLINSHDRLMPKEMLDNLIKTIEEEENEEI